MRTAHEPSRTGLEIYFEAFRTLGCMGWTLLDTTGPGTGTGTRERLQLRVLRNDGDGL
jgi:hypothetical protein